MRTQSIIRPVSGNLTLWGAVGEPSMTSYPHVVKMPAPLLPLIVHADSIAEAEATAQTVLKLHALSH